MQDGAARRSHLEVDSPHHQHAVRAIGQRRVVAHAPGAQRVCRHHQIGDVLVGAAAAVGAAHGPLTGVQPVRAVIEHRAGQLRFDGQRARPAADDVGARLDGVAGPGPIGGDDEIGPSDGDHPAQKPKAGLQRANDDRQRDQTEREAEEIEGQVIKMSPFQSTEVKLLQPSSR